MLARRRSMAWITRKGSSAASWVCVSRTCASPPTCTFSSTRASPTASGSASSCGKSRKGNQAPAAGTPIFIFDASDASRAGSYEPVVTQARVVVNIDHHVSNTRFATINLVLTDAASTGELVYDLLKAWKIDIPPGAASNLYATILSDTGGFRHDNTSAHALRAAAELVQLGADPVMLARGLFKSRPASSLRMQGRILQGLHYEFGD